MTTMAFIAGLAVGTILGFAIFFALFWVAKHYNEVDSPYYDDEDDYND